MNENRNDKEMEKRLLQKTKILLAKEEESLDSRTKQRLERIRLDALSPLSEKRTGIFFPFRWVTTGVLAGAVTAAIAVFLLLRTPTCNLPGKQIEDFEIMTSKDQIELYENLDFYRWLPVQDDET